MMMHEEIQRLNAALQAQQNMRRERTPVMMEQPTDDGDKPRQFVFKRSVITQTFDQEA